MSYDLHIRRVPPEGWEQWHENFERNLPASLREERAAAEAAADWEPLHQVKERIRLLSKEAERVQGLSISSAEWRAAVEATPGVRIALPSDCVIINPRTGDKITIKAGPDSVAVQDKDGQWHGAILFHHGYGSFRGHAWEEDHPVGQAVCRLAILVSARIRGDDGEEYPLYPGSRPTKR